MKISKSGIGLVKRWEGCRLTAYLDGGGVWTIGYGLTSAAGIIEVKKGLKITQAQADEYLARALVKYEAAVSKVLTRVPTQAQFDAMTSLCYNIGPGSFANSSVVRRFNDGNVTGAADAFLMWVKDEGKEVEGLVNRRKDERRYFLHEKPVAAPEPPQKPPAQAPAPEPPLQPGQSVPPPPVPQAKTGVAAIVIGALGALIAALAAWIMKGG